MPVSFIPFVFPGVDNVRCAFQTRWQEAGDGPYAGGNISLATADDRQSVIGNRRELRAALGLRLPAHPAGPQERPFRGRYPCGLAREPL